VSAISSILSAVAPWSQATLSESDRCVIITCPSFGLNDPQSRTTSYASPIVKNSRHETANFDNLSALRIHCLKFGDYVRSIPPPYPEQCDFIIYDDSNRVFCLVEMKVTTSSGVKTRQLRKTLEHLFNVSGVRLFADPFSSKRCCYFRKTPPSPAPTQTVVTAFNRPAKITSGCGRRVTNSQLTKGISTYGFELWHFSDYDVCQLA